MIKCQLFNCIISGNNRDDCCFTDEPARVDEGITQIPAQRNLDILEESWYVTPPSCFDASQDNSLSLQTSPLENLLIEHPSMSVYGGDLTDAWVAVTQSFTAEETPENDQVSSISSTTTLEPRSHTHRRAVRSLDKAQKLSRHVQKNVLEQAKKQYKKKKLQAHNQTYAHVTRSRRKQKKLDRKQGKPSTVYSHRGC